MWICHLLLLWLCFFNLLIVYLWMDILTGTYISACVIYNLSCYCISHPRNHQPCHLQPDDVPGQHILDLSVLTVANLHVPCHLNCLSLMTIDKDISYLQPKGCIFGTPSFKCIGGTIILRFLHQIHCRISYLSSIQKCQVLLCHFSSQTLLNPRSVTMATEKKFRNKFLLLGLLLWFMDKLT